MAKRQWDPVDEECTPERKLKKIAEKKSADARYLDQYSNTSQEMANLFRTKKALKQVANIPAERTGL